MAYMSRFPKHLDYSNTSHFLFELGSLMSTLFVLLFTLSAIAIGVSFVLGSVSQLGIFAAGISGLLSLFGVGILYFSVNVEQ